MRRILMAALAAAGMLTTVADAAAHGRDRDRVVLRFGDTTILHGQPALRAPERAPGRVIVVPPGSRVVIVPPRHQSRFTNRHRFTGRHGFFDRRPFPSPGFRSGQLGGRFVVPRFGRHWSQW